MKIATWNINGIRTTYQPVHDILKKLNADVVCFQETKVTRDMLLENCTIVENYNSYFSFSKTKSGYSGVATFCKDHFAPAKAEEGLTDIFCCDSATGIGEHRQPTGFTDDELRSLDGEGRAILTQHDIKDAEGDIHKLTIINVYCPRADPEKPERQLFKQRFCELLQHRAEQLLDTGSHVIVLGDLNICHRPIDHCDPVADAEFSMNPSRVWLSSFLHGGGEDEQNNSTNAFFTDSFRYFHPDQQNSFTCWNTASSARATNYGTRIDYILGDTKLVETQFEDCENRSDIEGSDHCPVIATLKCHPVRSAALPDICTKFLPEFAGTQQKLFKFFSKSSVTSQQCDVVNEPPPKKPKLAKASSSNKQAKLGVFMFKKEQSTPQIAARVTQNNSQSDSQTGIDVTAEARKPQVQKGASSQWRELMKGPETPKCSTHQEPCVLRTVKKDSLNKGRQFWVCNRPEGLKTNKEARCDFFVWVEKKKKK